MTKADWYKAARHVHADASANDPDFTETVTTAITGRSVFAWDLLTLKQLRAIHRHLFAVARL